MTTTDLAAALLRDVPRYDPCNCGGATVPDGHWLTYPDVLAALTAALDGVDERAGEVLEGVTQGRVVQFHPHFCEEAKGAPFGKWDTSHDLSVIRPDGERYRIGSMRHADDAAFFQWCHANIPAILAQNAALRKERDLALAGNRGLVRLNEATEARAERFRSALEEIAEYDTGATAGLAYTARAALTTDADNDY